MYGDFYLKLEAAIDKIIYMNGGTWTGAAINHAKDRVFDFTRSASKTCIVLTDGVSADRVQGPGSASELTILMK